MSTSTSPSWRVNPAVGVSDAGAGSGAHVLRVPGLEGPPPDESIWSGPMLGFLAAIVVAVPVVFVVLMLTTFGALQDTDDSSAAVITDVVSEATESLNTVLEPSQPSTVAVAPAVTVEDDAVDPAPQLGQLYVVVAGDVLHQIALRFAVTTEALAAYNALTNPNALRIGQELRVPPPGYQPPAPEDLESVDGGVPDFPTGPLTPRG